MEEEHPLGTLREAIADVDRALLELLRHRMDLAAEVGRLKAAAGAPVVVRGVEEKVLTRARQYAEACGVSEDVMEAVFEAIISGSVERQHRVGAALRSRQGGRVLVLGGAGAMGAWLRAFLELVGHHVEAVDPALAGIPRAPGRYSALEEVRDLDGFDFILVSVPLSLTSRVLSEVTRRRPRGVVVEIASIKSHLAEALAAADAAGVAVSSLHPMFGPAKSPYEPLTFVLACREDAEAERERLARLIRHPFTQVIGLPFAHHDRLMGWLLGLAHLSGMVFGAALTRAGLDPEELRRCASTTFARQAATALSVLSEDPDLYLDIQRLNPHRREVYDAMERALQELVGTVEREDREGFRQLLADARRAVAG
jgi:chorismate mutase/prephenate dehydrogenase